MPAPRSLGRFAALLPGAAILAIPGLSRGPGPNVAFAEPTCVPLAGSTVAARAIEVPPFDVTIRPAATRPAGFGSSALRAVQRACEEEGPPGATGASAIYGLFSSPQLGQPTSVPAWVVTFEGVCLPHYGPAGNPYEPLCAATEWNVVIHGVTETLIAAYGVGSV